MRPICLALLAGWICFSAIGCGPPLKGPDDKLRVAVSIVPQSWLVKKIGGEHVEVFSLSKPGEDPHTYSPTDAEVSDLMRSKVYFRIGIEFEQGNWFRAIEKSQTLKMVDLRRGIDLLEMTPHHHHHHDDDHDGHDHEKGEKEAHDHKKADKAHKHDHDHSKDVKKEKATSHLHDHDHDHDHDHGHAHDHGHEHAHDHGGKDPHIWLSPALLKKQAHTIAATLADVDPAHRDAYMANLKAVEQELDEADKQIREQLAPLKGKAFFVFHPAWGYFADAYGLRQLAIEVEGKEPSDQELTEVQQAARKEGAKVIFVQPQIPGRAAQAVAQAIGARTENLDPMAEDVLENLKRVAAAIAKSYQ